MFGAESVKLMSPPSSKFGSTVGAPSTVMLSPPVPVHVRQFGSPPPPPEIKHFPEDASAVSFARGSVPFVAVSRSTQLLQTTPDAVSALAALEEPFRKTQFSLRRPSEP